jgi:predicted nicotinamide N-methyase
MITNFLHHQTFQWGPHQIKLCIPDSRYIQRLYRDQKHSDPKTPFPYWTQVWPAALAMTEFLVTQPGYVRGKKVLEIAAGLGLPSLVAAQWAEEVHCSDYLPEAVAVIEQSVVQNALTNVKPLVLDWNHIPADLPFDVLLVSDINYDPSQFAILYDVLHQFWKKGATIILSTPQRLMAKPFVEKILPLAEKVEEVVVRPYEERIAISLFVLREIEQKIA